MSMELEVFVLFFFFNIYPVYKFLKPPEIEMCFINWNLNFVMIIEQKDKIIRYD